MMTKLDIGVLRKVNMEECKQLIASLKLTIKYHKISKEIKSWLELTIEPPVFITEEAYPLRKQCKEKKMKPLTTLAIFNNILEEFQ